MPLRRRPSRRRTSSHVARKPQASYCESAVTSLQFPIQVCFPCNDHAQPATPTAVTDNLVK